MKKKPRILTRAQIDRYARHLLEQEKSAATIRKYVHDLEGAARYFQGAPLTKPALIEWKSHMAEQYAPASVNSALAAVNGLFRFLGWHDLTVKPLKIQRSVYLEKEKELTRAEYTRLVRAAEAEGSVRLSLAIQTICATGIRVSELRFITAEAVRTGRAEVSNKGKRRTVFLPEQLCQMLRLYLKEQKRTAGAVFVTRNGTPLDRSNVWREMKGLCEKAGVAPGKVFPHNLRHLFARTYYHQEKDLSRLADILGHNDVNTTKIYTAESGAVHARQIGRLGLLIT